MSKEFVDAATRQRFVEACRNGWKDTSRASWEPFEEAIRRILLVQKRKPVSDASAKAIAREITDECGRYILTIRWGYGNLGASTIAGLDNFRTFMANVVPATEKFRTFLKTCPTLVSWGWTKQDRDDLDARLQKLVEEAGRTGKHWLGRKKGAPVDGNRHILEDSVARILVDHGVQPKTTADGTFARILQHVHDAVGIPERETHKSARRAISALKKTRKAS